MIHSVDVSLVSCRFAELKRLNPHTNTQRLRTSCSHGTQTTFNEYTWTVLCTELYAVVDIHTPWTLTIGMWKIH